MLKAKITKSAAEDLAGIKRYTVGKWGNEQAKTYISSIKAGIVMLAENPKAGTARPDVDHDVYSFVHKRHVIYYLIEPRQIVVLGVLSGAMLPKPHIDDRLKQDLFPD